MNNFDPYKLLGVVSGKMIYIYLVSISNIWDLFCKVFYKEKEL
jgi:hypothetical protein